MSYVKRDNIPVPAGWTAVEFEDGSLARVRCDRKPVGGGVSYIAKAVAIDAEGATQHDALGREVASGTSYLWPVAAVEQHGDAALTLKTLKVVMGEPVDLAFDTIRNSPSVNIRAAIAAAAVSGAADAGAVL